MYRPSLALLLSSTLLAIACGDKDDKATSDTGRVDRPEPDTADPGEEEAPCADPGGDEDGDGLTNEEEDEAGTDCTAADTDGDGLTDSLELEVGTDPTQADPDEDGLSDFEELRLCTDPQDADTDGDGTLDGEDETPGFPCSDGDGDGLSDDFELAWGTDPDDPDSDGDFLSDLDELVAGTNPNHADPDGDLLTDPEELALGTDPYDADTDGDGVRDGQEVENGTDPLVADRPVESGDGIGDTVRCGSAVQLEESLVFGNDGDFYTSFRAGFGGQVCECTFALTSTTPTPVTGVTIYLPTDAHSGTDWASSGTEPIPKAVAIDVPWDDPAVSTDEDPIYISYHLDSAPSASTDAYNEIALEDERGTREDHWIAFNASTSLDDGTGTGGSSVAIDGDYTVYVSMLNKDDEELPDCSVLAPSGSSSQKLKLRVDNLATFAARPTFPLSRHLDPLAGVPGRTARSRMALIDFGRGPRPVLVGGEPRHAGALVQKVQVVDWKGADFVEVRLPQGPPIRLHPESPVVMLPTGTNLVDIRWKAGRSSPGAWMEPEVDLTHLTPDNAPAQLQVPLERWPLSWRALEKGLVQATGGLSLETLLPGIVHKELGVIDVDLVQTEQSTELQLRAHEAGLLRSLPLDKQPDGRFRFSVRDRTTTLKGTVQKVNGALEINLESGSFMGPSGPIPLQPARLLLPAPAWSSHAPQ